MSIIRWGAGLALFTPLVVINGFFFLFVGPKTLYFYGLTEIIFFAWLFLAILNPLYRPRKNALLTAVGVFIGFLILSSVFGANPAKSFWSNFERMAGLLTMLHLAAFFLVLANSFKEKSDWQKIFSISLLVAAIVALLAILPKLGLPDLLKSLPAKDGATLGNTSFLASYLLLNGFLALRLLFTSSGKRKIFSAMSFVLIVLGLISSTGYAAIFSFLLGLFLLFCLWLIFKTGPAGRLLGVVCLGGLIIFGLAVLALSLRTGSSLNQTLVEHFSKSRLIVWDAAWQGFKERPLLGWGPENFNLAFYKRFDPCLFLPVCSPQGEIWFDRAHSVLFDGLAQTGILGVLSYLAIFASAFYCLWQGWQKKRFIFWTAAIFSAGLIAYFVQNLTVFDMISSYMLFFLFLGFIASGYSAEQENAPGGDGFKLKNQKKKLLALSLVAAGLFLSFFFFTLQPFRADYYMMAALNKPNTNERIAFFKKSLAASPLGREQTRDFFSQSLRANSQDKIALDFIAGELEKTVKRSPLDFRSQLRLGEFYNSYGRVDRAKFNQAKTVLDKAVAVSPTNQYGYWALSDAEMALGNSQRAIALLEKAVALEPKLGTAHLRLITGLLQMGNKTLAEQKAREATRLLPELSSQIQGLLSR